MDNRHRDSKIDNFDAISGDIFTGCKNKLYNVS